MADRRRLVAGLWWASAVATALTGAVVGFGAVWLQLFGDSADRGDYLISTGGYATAASLLALGAGAAAPRGRPVGRRAAIAAGAVAGVLVLLALRSLSAAARVESDGFSDSPLDGVGGVVLCPWTWPVAALGARGLWRWMRERGRRD